MLCGQLCFGFEAIFCRISYLVRLSLLTVPSKLEEAVAAAVVVAIRVEEADCSQQFKVVAEVAVAPMEVVED